jgi:hypothetical protein
MADPQPPTDPIAALREAAKFLRHCRGTEPAVYFESHAIECEKAATLLAALAADRRRDIAGDDASREAATRMSVRGPSPTPHRVRPPGSTVTLAEYNMALAEADALRERLVASENHHC